MDSAVVQQGLVGLRPGEVLRLRETAGRHISVVQGIAWVTQDGDPRDFVLGSGDSHRFDRNGFTLVMPLGVETRLMLEAGLVPENRGQPDAGWLHGEDLTHFERRAHRLRSEAMAQALASISAGLKAIWGWIARLSSDALQAGKTARDLNALSNHSLRDIGLRRDQIDCVARRIPC